MECSCAVYDDLSDAISADFLVVYNPNAIKEHTCCECQRIIHPGESYHKEVGKFEGYFECYKTCNDCYSLRKQFFSKGFMYGNIRDDLFDFIINCFGEIPEECISKLTKKAREYVCTIIEMIYEDLENEI